MAKKAVAKTSKASKFLIGAGIAAATAAGVAAFLTQSKQGKELAKKGREHAADLSREVSKRVEKSAKMTKAMYEEMIDDIMVQYKKRKKLTEAAAKDLTAQLKKEWTQIQKELKK